MGEGPVGQPARERVHRLPHAVTRRRQVRGIEQDQGRDGAIAHDEVEALQGPGEEYHAAAFAEEPKQE